MPNLIYTLLEQEGKTSMSISFISRYIRFRPASFLKAYVLAIKGKLLSKSFRSIFRAAKCMYKEGKSFTLLLNNDNAICFCKEELFLEFRYGSVTFLYVLRDNWVNFPNGFGHKSVLIWYSLFKPQGLIKTLTCATGYLISIYFKISKIVYMWTA